MPRNCKCGGRLVPQPLAGLVAVHKVFICDKCGVSHSQRLSQPVKRF